MGIKNNKQKLRSLDMKSSKLMAVAIILMAGSSLFGAVDLSALSDTSTAIGDATQTTTGTFVKMILAFLPALGFIVAPIVTFVVKKDEAKQNRDDHFGLWMWVIGMAMVGFIGGTVLVYLVGMGLLGNADGISDGGTEALKIASNWWKNALTN